MAELLTTPFISIVVTAIGALSDISTGALSAAPAPVETIVDPRIKNELGATPPANVAARTYSQDEFAVGSVVASTVCTTTIETKPFIAAVIEERDVRSRDVLPTVSIEPLCLVYASWRAILTCKRPFESKLTAQPLTSPRRGPSTTSVIASLRIKERKLLDLYYADKIDQDGFGEESRRLTTQRLTLESEIAEVELALRTREYASLRFEQVANVLTELDLEALWDKASFAERRILIEDLVDSVNIFPDQLTVQIVGAPPILVTLQEVGLNQGCKPVVSEAGLEPARP